MPDPEDPWPTPLAKLLAGQGPMPFRDYMAETLYAPKHGYYTRRDRRGGQGRLTGDTVYVAGLANQLAQSFTRFAQDHRPRLVEQGAGSAKLMRFLLAALPEELRERLELVFIEPRLARRTRLVAVVEEFGVQGKVIGAPSNLAPGPAFVVAKELISSFPVHLVEAAGEAWQEVEVSFGETAWSWEEHLDDPPVWLATHLDTLAPGLPAGHRYEANLQLDPWLGEVTSALDPGILVVLDRMRPDLGPPGGTLVALRDGEEVSPYAAPGEADLSAAVDRRALLAAAERHGLRELEVREGLGQAAAPLLSPVGLGIGGL